MFRMPIDITGLDARRLRAVLSVYQDRSGPAPREVNQLRGELERARVVPSREVSHRVVTMNSEVVLRDLASQQEFICKLSYPDESDIDAGRISVLAPVGTAILGYREGTVVEWNVPAGTRRLRMEKILYQPEAVGDFDRQRSPNPASRSRASLREGVRSGAFPSGPGPGGHGCWRGLPAPG